MENIIDEKLLQDINDYCKINGLDTKKYVNQKLKSALMLDKYGSSPFRTIKDNIEPEIVEDKVEPVVVVKKEKEKPIKQVKNTKKQPKQEKNDSTSNDEKIIVNKRMLK